MKIAVMGAGSIGTIVGAYISKAYENVFLIDVNQAHVDQLNEKGAKIVGTTDEIIPVRAITPAQMEETYDVVLLLTKQHFNGQVLDELMPFLHDESVICSLQNGVPESDIVAVVGEQKVIAGSVEFGATYIEPGISELTSHYNEFKKLAFMIGELSGGDTARLKEVQHVLSHVGGTVTTDNLMGMKWSKLVINASMSGLSTVLNCTYGDILSNGSALEYAIRLIDETVRVGHRKGIDFAIMFGLVFNEYLIEKRPINELMEEFKQTVLPHSKLKASMLQDLEKGNETEIDFINGVVVDTGKEAGIDTPLNSQIVELVKQAENNNHLPNFRENIEKVKQLGIY